MSWNNNFYNPENELETKYSNTIHMHKVMRNGKKSNIIVQGLVFSNETDIKDFISKISTKCGTGGSYKMMEDYDKKNKVFMFNGDKREQIKQVLMSDYGKEEDFIKYHG